MGAGSKISALIKVVKTWVAANKAAAGILAGVFVAGGGTAVALGAGAFSQPVAAETTQAVVQTVPESTQAELSGEDIEAIYVPNLLRGDLIGEPLLNELWESLEAAYNPRVGTTAEETTTEEETETTKKEKVEIPPVVVAPVNDKEDEQPQDDADKGTSDELDIKDVIEQEKEKEEEGEYENISRSYGIDVSKWQYSIDWAQVAASGVEFAMIRVGYRGNQTGEIVMDPYFERNIKGALANHIKVGIYFYSQAIDEEEAKQEAAWVVNVIQKYQITYPVVYDCEGLGQNRIKDVTKTQRSKNAAAFLDYIRGAGYTPMMYASKYGYNKNWDMSYIKNCKIWLAHYTSGGLNTHSDYSGTYHMWQYTSKGSVPGIRGNVDLNVAYFSYSNTPDPVIGTVNYTVVDDTGAPVKGATVSMKGANSRRILTAETGDNGIASFANVVVDDYNVEVTGIPEYYKKGAQSTAQISFGKAENIFEGRLSIDRIMSTGVSCEVVDMNAKAVAGVTVTLAGTSRLGTAVQMSAVTDAGGKAVFANVPLGSYETYVSAVPEGYEMPAAPVKEIVEVTSSAAVTVKQKMTVKAVKPSESETPEEPSTDNPGETTKPDETTKPAETTKPDETTKPSETTKPDETATAPAETTTEPVETTTPAETTTAAPATTTAAPSSSPAETTTTAAAAPAESATPGSAPGEDDPASRSNEGLTAEEG